VTDWFPWWPFVLLVVVAALALRESRRWLFGFWAWWPSLAGPVAWILFYHFMTAFRLDLMPYRPRYLYFFLPSFVFLVTALALGKPGLKKSEGQSERAHLLHLPIPEGGN
jgi:hypothetical protein